MIADFINILRNAKLEPTAIDIAEMLLLAAYIPAPAVPAQVEPDLKENGVGSATDQPRITPKTDPLNPASVPQTTDAGGLFAETEEDFSEGEGGVETVAFRTPKASALPGAHKIARALRPLRRRHPSNRHFVLDEERTIRQIADGGPHSPVMKPAPERWLDVALVFDASLTMQLWRPTLAELQRLFERCGIFRDVRPWHLDTDRAIAKLRSAAGEQVSNVAHSWRELLDPTRRRLIVVVSDCHAESWHNGDAYRLLTDWGMQSPVALVQVLPERFWPTTTMTPVDAALRAYRPGLTNQRLEVSPVWYRDLIRAGGLPLPVVTLEEWSIAPWARMISGSSGVTPLGLIVPPLPERDAKRDVKNAVAVGKSTKKKKQKTAEPKSDAQPRSAKDLVKTFFTNASPLARQLACYLASAPLSLPVMQLVQQAMLPASCQSHLAEVFLGGLIYQPAPKGDRKPKPDEIIFEFHDGVRDELINRITKAETVMVITAVSSYVEQRLGVGGEFGALLALPGVWGGGPRRRLDPLSRRFAQLSTTILRRFGGYESHLAQIETLFNLVDPSLQMKEPEPEFRSAESLIKQADSLLSQGKMVEAENLYQRVLGLLPADDRAWRGLAEIVRRAPRHRQGGVMKMLDFGGPFLFSSDSTFVLYSLKCHFRN